LLVVGFSLQTTSDILGIGEMDEHMKNLKIIVEKHEDGYVAYPLGLKGVVVGQGETYDEAMADVKSAIKFHIETFGNEVLEDQSTILEAFVVEAGVPV